MTLADVAAQQRARVLLDAYGMKTPADIRDSVVEAFEADPDFKLRERLEAFINSALPALPSWVVSCLREVLEGKP